MGACRELENKASLLLPVLHSRRFYRRFFPLTVASQVHTFGQEDISTRAVPGK